MKKIFFSLFVPILFSCETVVTDDITLNDSKPRLVINGGIERNTITPLTEQKIELTSTIGFLEDGEPTPVNDATVTISDGIDDFNFESIGNGQYTNSDISPRLNAEYTITINWKNETYVGSDFITEVPPFDRVYSEFEEGNIFSDEGYFVKFDATDPIDIENYYYYRVYKNNEFVIVADPGNNFTLAVSDQFFDGQPRIGVIPNEEIAFEIGDIGKIQQLSISKDYYNFLVELFIQTGNQGGILIGNPPPASIRSNIINIENPSNRILGYFYAVDVEEATIEISE
jgi:hypothetical protein